MPSRYAGSPERQAGPRYLATRGARQRG